MANAINWFEIPATNFDRAKKFYSSIFNAELHLEQIVDTQMAFLPVEEGGVGGAICAGKDHKPSAEGTIPYLNGGDDLNGVLNRVEAAGGQVVLPKTQISEEIGYYAFFMDTEGNKIALHSKA
jgi:predicted enzyme related to lactoylglutathione lyase